MNQDYPILTLKKGRERSVHNFHPWVFSGAVHYWPKTAQSGDIIAVHALDGQVLGYGFFDADSQITVRMMSFRAEERPDNEGFWQQKIARAYALRQSWVVRPETNTYRLIHAEGDGMPGIIADVYGGDTVVLQLRTKGSERMAPILTEALQELGYRNIYLKNKQFDGVTTAGSLPDGWLAGGQQIASPLISLEHGLQFEVDVVHGQKTGFFIDQRENRALIGQLAKGKKVLNAFSYSGGFSVYAAAGGAREVHSVDISKDAVALADRNMKLNFPDYPHQAVAEDCFKYLKQMDKDFDLVILDPPAFAKSIGARDRAARGYKEINLSAMRSMPKGSLLATFSCSQVVDRDLFRKIVFGAAADSGREVRILYQLTQPADHPVNIYHPEGEYLKGLILQID